MFDSSYKSWKSEGKVEGFAEGMAAGILEARREDVVRVLQLRFPGSAPADLVAMAKQLPEPAVALRWLEAAATAATPDIFRRMVLRD